MRVHLMDELVEVMLVPLAKIDKCLDGLIGICRCILVVASLDNLAKC